MMNTCIMAVDGPFEKILGKFDGIQRRISVLSPGKVADNIWNLEHSCGDAFT